jgi:hypothetical protein
MDDFVQSIRARPGRTFEAMNTVATPFASPLETHAAPPHGAPKTLLRAEDALVLCGAVAAYHHLGGPWALFALLFLAPDLSMLGYAAGPRAGAAVYNAVHTYLAPAALAVAGIWLPSLLPLAAIWSAHIAADRILGYGLKYASGFGDTHLGKRGKAR